MSRKKPKEWGEVVSGRKGGPQLKYQCWDAARPSCTEQLLGLLLTAEDTWQLGTVALCKCPSTSHPSHALPLRSALQGSYTQQVALLLGPCLWSVWDDYPFDLSSTFTFKPCLSLHGCLGAFPDKLLLALIPAQGGLLTPKCLGLPSIIASSLLKSSSIWCLPSPTVL